MVKELLRGRIGLNKALRHTLAQQPSFCLHLYSPLFSIHSKTSKKYRPGGQAVVAGASIAA
jgi:hypothetical protein